MTPEQERVLFETIGQTHEVLATITATCQHRKQILDEHHATLFGNTSKGLKSSMVELRGDVRALSKSVDLLREAVETSGLWFREKLGVVLVVLLGIAATAAGVTGVYKWINNQPPVGGAGQE